MNIFYLDHSPLLAAQYHCDKHVIKMILESVQILSTVAHKYDIEAPYKPTHRSHPSVLWAGEAYEHALWLGRLVADLNAEYRYRYQPRDHASWAKLLDYYLVPKLEDVMPHKQFTPPPQCMPEEYRGPDAVEAYRTYYTKGKAHLHTWTHRGAPEWLGE